MTYFKIDFMKYPQNLMRHNAFYVYFIMHAP
jgi:hypothetical protein